MGNANSCFSGHGEVIKDMLLYSRVRKNPNQADSNKRKPLGWAAYEGHRAVVKELLKAGALLNIEDEDENYAPLLLANKNKHEDVRILVSGINQDHRHALLIRTTESDHETIVKAVISSGTHPDVSNNQNRTILSLWAARGNRRMVDLLLGRGSNPEIQMRMAEHLCRGQRVKIRWK
jgi:ankyrin repeat protein